MFIQAYNETNFQEELNYAKNYPGIAITEQQLYRVKDLVNNDTIKDVLVFHHTGERK